MKTELRKVFKCDHCSKKMFSAGAMGYHEKWCKKNPNNRHKCFALCCHLKRDINVIWSDGEGSGAYNYVFTCLKTGQKMYSYKLEKRSLYAYRKLPIDAVRMPLECELFQEMSYDEQCQRFGL
jgi:hypothetical protein